jgi:hypothetical protein
LVFTEVWAVIAVVVVGGVAVVVVVDVLEVAVVVVAAMTGTTENANKVRITIDKMLINTNLRGDLRVIFSSCP